MGYDMKKSKKNKGVIRKLIPDGFPRFHCVVYAEKLDPHFYEFKKLIEESWRCFNSKKTLSIVFKKAVENNNFRRFHHGIANTVIDKLDIGRFEDFLTYVLHEEIIQRGGQKFFPYCKFDISHHFGSVYRIAVSSFSVKKSSENPTYFPYRKTTMKYEGSEFEVGFSKHAIERLGDRVVVGRNVYLYDKIFFMYMNNYLYVKKGFISNLNTNKKTLCAEIYRPMYTALETDKFMIEAFSEYDGNVVDYNKYRYYLKAAYAPLLIDRTNMTAKAKTVLIPGMKGTPEQVVLENRDGRQTPEENLDLQKRYEKIGSKMDIDLWANYFRMVCHSYKINQFIRVEINEPILMSPYLNKIEIAAERMWMLSQYSEDPNATGYAVT